MKTLQQSPTLRTAFPEKINAKKSTKRQKVQQILGNNLLGQLGSFLYEFKQAKNQFQGSMGEWGIAKVKSQKSKVKSEILAVSGFESFAMS